MQTVLYKSKYGFRQKTSKHFTNQTVVVELITIFAKAILMLIWFALRVLLDLHKAFDHNIPISKLEFGGITDLH